MKLSEYLKVFLYHNALKIMRMMTTIRTTENEQVSFFLKILRNHFQEITDLYKVKYLGIFGSFIRSEQKNHSDLDVLVAFNKPPSLFQYIHLESYLSELLQVKVDLVMKEALKPTIGKQILKEVVEV